jgi:hypothetical protein
MQKVNESTGKYIKLQNFLLPQMYTDHCLVKYLKRTLS